MLRTILHSLQQKSPIKVLSNRWATRQLSHSFSSQQQPGSQNPIGNPSHAQQKDAKTPLQQFKASRQAYLAFLSWAFLFKLRHLRQEEIYVNCLSSIRKQLLKELKTVRGSQGNASESQYNEIRREFLKPYELGQGIKVPSITDPSAYRSRSQPKYAILNPTSFTKVMLKQLQYHNVPLVVGNLGIGKSFNLWGFSYLSYNRFKHLFQNQDMRDIARLIQINYQFFNPYYPKNSKQATIKKITQELKYLPFIVYYRLRAGQSWKQFYQNLFQQFPYLQRKKIKIPKIKKGVQDEEAKKIVNDFYKQKSQFIIWQLKQFCGKLLKNGFDEFKIVIDQASQYTKLLKIYYQDCQKMRKKGAKIQQIVSEKQKTQPYSSIKDMSDKIELFRQVYPYIRFYYSEITEFNIFEKEHASEYLADFTKLYHKPQDNEQSEFHYGFNLESSFAQNQMFTILTLFLQQRILKQYYQLQNKNVNLTQESFVSAMNSLNIEEIVESSRGLKQFSRNTTCLTITKVLNQIDEKMYTQIVQLLEAFAIDAKTEEGKQKLKEKIKTLFQDSLKRIEQLNFQTFNQRITKRLNESKQYQKWQINQFYSSLELVLAQSMNEDKLLKLHNSKNILKEKRFNKSQEHDEAFQGQFSGQLQGTINGKKLIGTFDGTLISGTFKQLSVEEFKKHKKQIEQKREIPKLKTQNEQKRQGNNLKMQNNPNISNESQRQGSSNLRGVLGILLNGEFSGKLSGLVQEGILLGKLKGVFTGKHVSNQAMEDYWSNTPYEIKGKSYLRIATAVLGRYIDRLGVKQAQKLQMLTHKSLCVVSNKSIKIEIPKHSLMKLVYKTFFSEKTNQQIRQYLRILLKSDRVLQILADEWLTIGLASLKGTLRIKNKTFDLEKIQIVNRFFNGFIHFLVKNQPLEFHFRNVSILAETLKPGQGIGAMPITSKGVYSTNSKSIDAMIIFKTYDGVLHYCSLDFFFGYTDSQITNKIQKHKTLIKQSFEKDLFFSKAKYCHYILVFDSVYQEFLKNKQTEIHAEVKVARISDFEFDIQQLKNVNQSSSKISEQAKQCKAALQALNIKNIE